MPSRRRSGLPFALTLTLAACSTPIAPHDAGGTDAPASDAPTADTPTGNDVVRMDTTSRPDAPVQPDVPTQPDVPAQPDVSMQPDVAMQPDVPDLPDVVDVVVPPDAPPPPPGIDATTLDHHLLMGYQGWFYAQGDGSMIGDWVHWSISSPPGPGNVTFEAWPDLREFAANELYPTDFHYADGSAASLYSSYAPATADRHFQWMQDAGIDGVFLQRFVSELSDYRFLDARDTVTRNVRAGAEAHGRVFAIEYDISGANPDTVVQDIENDWMHLVDDLGVIDSPRYQHHRGRPVLAVWGFGFTDRAGTPAQANALIDWLTRDAPPRYQVTLMGGVPSYWRTLTADSQSDPGWATVYRRFDVINPWMVGRYATDADVVNFRRNVIEPDVAEAARVGADYMPVVFPGFSWSHLMPGQPLNQIPRRGGAFWWKQAYEFTGAGATMFFGAMFDEVDEGTAMYKIAPTAGDAPTEIPWLTLDIDGVSLPSDWYLRLAGAGSRMIRGEIPRSATIPITP